jgi:hypothetical protein
MPSSLNPIIGLQQRARRLAGTARERRMCRAYLLNVAGFRVRKRLSARLRRLLPRAVGASI